MNGEKDYYLYLVQIMLKTRGARFTAARLLTVRDRFSVATLSILSMFLITLSIITLVSPDLLGVFGGKYFGTLSIVASTAILVITLFDYALGRGVLSYRLHQNAIRTTQLLREIERELERTAPNFDQLRLFAKNYEDENALTEVNHSSSDYKIYNFSRQKTTGFITAILYPLRNFFYSSVVFCISVFANISVLLFVAVAVIWYILNKS